MTDASYDWTQRFFSDGACPPDLEIFKVENNGTPYYYHRYNIAEELRFSDDDDTDDEKVSSLLKKDANKLNAFSFETLVDEKLSDNKTDDFIKRSWYKYVSGNSASQEHNFFFLGMIADEPGSFVNVETRRKQIVANFIDYYDKSSSAGNSIPDTPTSDVKPSDWGTGVLPSYTGNEKTFYINELGVVSKFNVTANARTLDVKVTPTLLAEIVGIYKNLDNGNYKLKSKIESISFDISGTVTKTKGTNGAESDSDISFGGDGAVLSGSASFVDSPDLEVSFTGSPSNGYLASSAAHGAVSVPVEISAVPADQSISEFTAEIKNIKIKFKDRAVLSKSNHNVDISRLPLSECDVDQNGMKLEFSNSSADNCAVIGNMSVIDPRQNLYVRTSNADGCTYSDWYFLPKIVKVGTGDYIGSDSDLSMAVTISDAGAIESLSGSVNKYSNPNIPRRVSVASGAQVIQNIPDGDCDIETANDPAYTNASSLSTAYIRDGYMQSMWELGLIHRGAAWETINLQSTAVTPSDMYNYLHSSFAGTKYGDGDAAILDTVKISKYAVNWGMYDINMLRTNAPGYDFTGSGEDRKLFKTIAESLVKYTSPDEATSDGLLSDGDLNVLYTKLPSKMDRRSMLVNSFDAMFEDRKTYWETDALREQAIGTLMPLLKAEPALVTVFHVDVVAQTIRDIGDVKVSKLKSDGTLSDAAETKLGEFDAVTDGSGLLYLDDITGQVKLRATFDCNPYTGKIKLRQIRYLD